MQFILIRTVKGLVVALEAWDRADASTVEMAAAGMRGMSAL